MIKAPKKLIEVALPLDDINAAAKREKSIRHGHPSTLHLWWARRPLAAARAVLFAQLVNDPGGERGWGNYPGQTKEDAQKERERLFGIIRELVKWENTNNEELLEIAREEIRKSWRETCEMNKGVEGFDPDKLPAFHDPFAGGGAIPLEAQRLGLESYATDLNPVAVMINKAMIEIPPKFTGRAPVGPLPQGEQVDGRGSDAWPGATGLAEDVRRYGHWMKKEAEKRIGHLYPKVEITEEMAKERPDLKSYVGRELTVIAWIWARTVKSPNPAFSHVDVPLVTNFMLSTKKGKEAYVEPILDGDSYSFKVKVGKPGDIATTKLGTSAGRWKAFKCLLSGSPIDYDYIREKGVNGELGDRLMAVVLEGDRKRIYIDDEFIESVGSTNGENYWKPTLDINYHPRDIKTQIYGLMKYGDLFTDRQLVALTCFSDLVQEAREKAIQLFVKAGGEDDGVSLSEGGTGATAYGDAVAVYLSFAVDKGTNYWSTLCAWSTSTEKMISTFGRQALPMVWDYTESNPFCSSSGNFILGINQAKKMLDNLGSKFTASALQADAASQDISVDKVVSTDPPYYDNIGYADLSDYFYVWMRKMLRGVFPDVFASMAVPKAEELVATPYRHGSKDIADKFFMDGMTKTMNNVACSANPSFPVTIYYAFKQSDTKNAATSSTGWESFLEAVIQSGFLISGTWPMRTEYTGNLKKSMNALASSIVLVCSKRENDAMAIPRRQFLRELKDELPEALEAMIGGKEGASPIAPVDLAQAAIGPGMGVFSRYSGILEADGSKMSVHDALILINKAIDEYFSEAEGEMDSDTRFCIDWFQTYGFAQAEFGQADVLARAKGTTVDGLEDAGVLEAGGGKVRLFKFSEYPDDWDPTKDNRLPVWEALHQLIRALREGGEAEAGKLLGRMADRMESIRQLAYRLYTLCERKGWAEEARAYNELIASWHGTVSASEASRGTTVTQLTLDMSN
ncbi:DUF1156 domain-containing protein [Desulfobaculum bizertense]|uniref:Putative DNA methylase n=1 Tax=Desulfobaculum bizertense DSM 18034 TaxID=1121442 RepID=A0A1T4VYR8_9BACT|nr:DUF1156 domain-containing protein [Desulfobaculum bizertense]SKA70039.1 putative DNA methylase [Desulfobaculum bizertense DSM 18034]